VILSRSSVFTNSGSDGGGIHIGASGSQLGSLSFYQSAIHDNNASSYGGGVYYAGRGNNQWNDSTISSNYAGTLGGGAYLAGTDYVQMNRLTIANNDAWAGGAFYRQDNTCNVYIYDSILGDNTASISGSKDGNGTVSDSQYSLFEVSSSITFLSSSNLLLGLDPKLNALQTWPSGIPTKVHPLMSTSPAVNVKSTSVSTVDQRGFSRCVGWGSNKCDIGAFERQ